MIKDYGTRFYKEDGWSVGDRVKCIDSLLSTYVVGETYTLALSAAGNSYLLIEGGNLIVRYSAVSARFELVSTSTKGKGFAKWMKEIESV